MTRTPTPNLITDVQTAPATTSDRVMTAVIQDHLAKRNLLPATHLVDVGYTSVEHLVTSQTKHHVDLVTPAPPDPSWQAKAQQGFDIRQFSIDWEAQTVTCPTSAWWIPGKDHLGLEVIDITFSRADCHACTVRAQCTHLSKSARTLSIRARPLFEALHSARARQSTPEFKQQYAARAGVEGTFAQTKRVADLRHARYIGLAKAHLQHLITAAAANVLCVVAWLDHVPRAVTFAALAPT